MVEYNEDGSLRDVARSSELDSKVDNTAVVHKSGAETISGTKTFNASPVIPESYNDNHAATKSYVDSSAGAGAPDATDTWFIDRLCI